MPKKKRVTILDTPRIQLNSISQVRRRMVKIYSLAESGGMAVNTASKLIWILCQIRDTLELEKIEPLLSEMEEEMSTRSGAPGFYRG